MLGETALAAAGLEKLKAAFSVFTNNTQIYPLVYDCKCHSSIKLLYASSQSSSCKLPGVALSPLQAM